MHFLTLNNNDLNHIVGQSRLLQRLMNKISGKSIICLFKIHLNHHETFLPNFLTHGVNNFLGNHDIVNDMPAKNKAGLLRANKVRH